MIKQKVIKIISDLVKKYPNDQDLGKNYREFSLSYKGELDEFCLEYPNYSSLGYFLRNKINKLGEVK